MADFRCKRRSVKRVAVIGAGMSGLASVKACLEENIHPVCFERTSLFGGLWAPHKTNFGNEAVVYPSLVFNTCKEMSCFSDFPYPKSYPTYIRPFQQYDYLQSFLDHFGLQDYIMFNTNVLEVSPTFLPEDGGGDETKTQKWKVRTRRMDQPEAVEMEEVFDAVMVCNGVSAEASIATYPDQEKFAGKILHSREFREGSDIENEAVLVVGIFLSTKDGTYVLPRLLDGGTPIDAVANTVLGSYAPRSLRKFMFGRMLSSLYDIEAIGLEPQAHGLIDGSHMVNDEMVQRVLCGMVTPKPAVERFTGDGVAFVDGTREKVDTVVLAVGYRTRFPFVDDAILADDLQERNAYLHVFATAPDRPTVAAIGMTREAGASAPVIEMQARFAVAVFKGAVRLPSKPKMAEHIDRTKKALVEDYGKLKCMLAQPMGCYPNIWRYLLRGDLRLASCLFFEPFFPYATRLRGNHSWSGARRAILDGMDNMFSATRRAAPAKRNDLSKVAVVTLLVVSCAFAGYVLAKRKVGAALNGW